MGVGQENDRLFWCFWVFDFAVIGLLNKGFILANPRSKRCVEECLLGSLVLLPGRGKGCFKEDVFGVVCQAFKMKRFDCPECLHIVRLCTSLHFESHQDHLQKQRIYNHTAENDQKSQVMVPSTPKNDGRKTLHLKHLLPGYPTPLYQLKTSPLTSKNLTSALPVQL